MSIKSIFFKGDSTNDFEIENAILKKYVGKGGNVVIPEGVTAIDRGAFEGCLGLRSVKIPDSVTRIETSAFSGCKNLSRISMPRTMDYIGNRVFWGCVGLGDKNGFIIIDGVLHLYMGRDERVVIPDGVTEIGMGAFEHRAGIKSVEIPCGVTRIGWRAFNGCTGLTSVTIPGSIEQICPVAFDNCRNLAALILPDDADSSVFERLWNDAHTNDRKALYAVSLLTHRMDMVSQSKLWQKNIKQHKNKIIALAVSSDSVELLSSLFSLYKAVGVETLDALLGEERLSVEMRAYLMDYKNRHYTAEQLERLEERKIKTELGGTASDE